MMYGLDVIVSTHLCEYKFLRWRKRHRKSRINRKWQKKYGCITSCQTEKVFQVGNAIYACPHMAAAINKGLDSK